MNTPSAPPTAYASRTLVAASLASLFAVVLFLVLPPQGPSPPKFFEFLGRFHTLLVHLPVGVLLLVASAELLTRFPRLRARVDPALDLALPFLLATAVAAFSLGLLLARGGGYPPKLVGLHRGFTLAAVLGVAGCLVAWARRIGPDGRSGAFPSGPRSPPRSASSRSAPTSAVRSRTATRTSRTSRPRSCRSCSARPPGCPGRARRRRSGRRAAGLRERRDAAAPPRVRRVPRPGQEQGRAASRLAGRHHEGWRRRRRRRAGTRRDQLAGQAHAAARRRRRSHAAFREDAADEREIDLLRWWIDRGANDTLKVRDAIVPEGARTILGRTLDGAAAPSSPEPPTRTAPAAVGVTTMMPSAPPLVLGGRGRLRFVRGRPPRVPRRRRPPAEQRLRQVPRQREAEGQAARRLHRVAVRRRQERRGHRPRQRLAGHGAVPATPARRRRQAHAAARRAPAHRGPGGHAGHVDRAGSDRDASGIRPPQGRHGPSPCRPPPRTDGPRSFRLCRPDRDHAHEVDPCTPHAFHACGVERRARRERSSGPRPRTGRPLPRHRRAPARAALR